MKPTRFGTTTPAGESRRAAGSPRGASLRRVGAQAGFTLVEIMIVVSIIGLLAAVAVPSLAKAREKSLAVATVRDLRVFEDALHMYAMENGGYPTMSFTPPVVIFSLGILPPPLDPYIKDEYWERGAPAGGDYYWSGFPMTYWGGSGKLGERHYIQIRNGSQRLLKLVAAEIEKDLQGTSPFGKTYVGFGDRLYYFIDPVTW